MVVITARTLKSNADFCHVLDHDSGLNSAGETPFHNVDGPRLSISVVHSCGSGTDSFQPCSPAAASKVLRFADARSWFGAKIIKVVRQKNTKGSFWFSILSI